MGLSVNQQILSDITVFMKYAKYIPELNRRETWQELVDRNKKMHLNKFPQLSNEIEEVYKLVYEKKILPSMRSLQFAGKPIEIGNQRIYNCCYLPLNHYKAFSETMFLLLSGCGVGYSVQFHHVEQLEPIQKPVKTQRYVVEDSIAGWADAVKMLMKSYFTGKFKPRFDFSDIRPKGSLLITSGGKAPGPEPLKICLAHIEAILENKQNGDKLTPIECHDIQCHLADAVLSGGIRRAAMIATFSFDDEDMLTCKYGNWWEMNPQRARANNSATILRNRVQEHEFKELWKKVELSNSGEPGISFSNDTEYGFNPSLKGDTLVVTDSGVFPIKDLEGKTFNVPNLDGNISNAFCRLSGNNKQLYKITLDTNKVYYATPEHKWPVFKNDKYIKTPTSELIAGDELPVNNFNRTELFSTGNLGNYNQGFLIGWLYGDGSVTIREDNGKTVYSFIVSDKDNVIDILFDEIYKIDGVKRKYFNRGKCKEFQVGNIKFHKWALEMGIGKKEFGIPTGIYSTWTEECRRGFIDGYFSSDGTVDWQDHRIAISSSNYKLIEDVQDLLGFYGIKSRTAELTIPNAIFPNGKTYNKTYYRKSLRINHNNSIKFYNLFKLSVEYKQILLDSFLKDKISKLDFVKIKEIELSDVVEDVWDITVNDETHCFQLSQVTTGNCHEISLRPNTFCNLVEINGSSIESQEDFINRCKSAAFLSTLQASYTDFYYLRPIWKQNTEKDALVGVGITGIASNAINPGWIKEGSIAIKTENQRVAKLIGINKAARTTTVKPSGTTSVVLGTSSGIHAWHNDYYIRRIRVNKHESIYQYLKTNHPNLVEDEYFRPKDTAVISIPQKAPEGSVLRTENVLDLLERIKLYNTDWVKNGHNKGPNPNNVSATVSIKPEEWEIVGNWMWENKDFYSGISVLPYDGGTYVQAPFENITKEQYEELSQNLHEIDLSKITELQDLTDLSGELACANGYCEI
jgi:hypothetical protein